MLYKLKITETQSGKIYLMEIKTPNLEWTMEQFQRNRPALTWNIIED